MEMALIILTIVIVIGLTFSLGIIFYMMERDWDSMREDELDLMERRINMDSNITNLDENINHKYKEIDAPTGYNFNDTVGHFTVTNQDEISKNKK